MPRGGKRLHAGRPKGRGPYGEPTTPMRIPLSLIDSVKQLIGNAGYLLPVYSSRVQAGLPTPAEPQEAEKLNLNLHLIKNPYDTFLLEVTGDSMQDAGIFPGDLLIVDRKLPATNNKIVIAKLNGEFTVKRFQQTKQGITLIAANQAYSNIIIQPHDEFEICGVVTNVIHAV